jgi:hypothetical protein
MTFEGAHGEPEKLSCPLLIEERFHGPSAGELFTAEVGQLKFAEKVLPNLPLNFSASLAFGLSARLAVPGLPARFAADELGPLQDWPNNVAFCCSGGEQSPNHLLR